MIILQDLANINKLMRLSPSELDVAVFFTCHVSATGDYGLFGVTREDGELVLRAHECPNVLGSDGVARRYQALSAIADGHGDDWRAVEVDKETIELSGFSQVEHAFICSLSCDLSEVKRRTLAAWGSDDGGWFSVGSATSF